MTSFPPETNDSRSEINRERFHAELDDIELETEKADAVQLAACIDKMEIVSTLPATVFKSASVIPTFKFTYTKERRSFVTEVSDLNEPSPIIRPLGPGGPSNLGFLMLNVRSGRAVPFRLVKVDGVEDVAGWRFEPTPDAIRADETLRGLTVLIIND